MFTPLQIEQHLPFGVRGSVPERRKPVNAAIMEAILTDHVDDLEPGLIRHGYSLKSLADQDARRRVANMNAAAPNQFRSIVLKRL
jgi:hypothetical protein